MIKPIETLYNGYRFRSRLEARWAVFFDVLGIKYEYEKEGYTFSDGVKYLPDFWLPEIDMWAEVKPNKFSEDEALNLMLLSYFSEHSCIFLVGTPNSKGYWSIDCRSSITHWPSSYQPILNESLKQLDYQYAHELYEMFSSIGSALIRFPGDLERAISASRSARFEFGEHGR